MADESDTPDVPGSSPSSNGAPEAAGGGTAIPGSTSGAPAGTGADNASSTSTAGNTGNNAGGTGSTASTDLPTRRSLRHQRGAESAGKAGSEGSAASEGSAGKAGSEGSAGKAGSEGSAGNEGGTDAVDELASLFGDIDGIGDADDTDASTASGTGAASRAGASGKATDTAATATTPRTKRRRRARAIWLTAIGVVVLLVLGAVGLFAWNIWSALGDIDRIDDALAGDYEGRPEPSPADTEGRTPLNIMLIGLDARESDQDLLTAVGERADAIMVVHVPADRENIQVMSIMRDSWVPIAGYGESKINAAYSFGSLPLMSQTVEMLIGQRIDHVGVVDFESFKGLTDAVGGVTLDNPIRFDSWHMPGHVFEQGTITLNGEEALAFVGERYAFIDGDYQRVRNQQLFLQALIGKVLSAETLGNPATVADLISTVGPYMAVDANLTNEAITTLAYELREVRRADVSFFTMPTSGTGLIGDQSVVFVDWVLLEKVRAAFADDTLDTLTLP